MSMPGKQCKQGWQSRMQLARSTSGPAMVRQLLKLRGNPAVIAAAASIAWWDLAEFVADARGFTRALEPWLSHPMKPLLAAPNDKVAKVLVRLGYDAATVEPRVADRLTMCKPKTGERDRGPNRRRNHGIAA